MKRAQPLRRRRKGPDALLTAKLDAATSQAARAAKPYCEVCSTQLTPAHRPVLHAHHIRGRSCFRLRWDLRNIAVLCYQHHFHLAHGDVIAQATWREWLKTHRSEDFAYIQAHAEVLAHYSRADKLAILAELQGELEEAA